MLGCTREMLQFGLIHRVMYTSCDNGIINNKCIKVKRVLIDHMIRRKGQDTDILSECVFCASRDSGAKGHLKKNPTKKHHKLSKITSAEYTHTHTHFSQLFTYGGTHCIITKCNKEEIHCTIKQVYDLRLDFHFCFR